MEKYAVTQEDFDEITENENLPSITVETFITNLLLDSSGPMEQLENHSVKKITNRQTLMLPPPLPWDIESKPGSEIQPSTPNSTSKDSINSIAKFSSTAVPDKFGSRLA